MSFRSFTLIAVSIVSATYAQTLQAAVVMGGSAEFVFNNNSALFSGGSGPLIMDRHYGTNVDTATGLDLINGVGGDLIIVPGTGIVTLNANINGSSVTQPALRARQATNLDVDFSNVLATWGPAEQIGIDSVLRTNVDPLFGGGVIGLGDYALRNQGGTLALVNNLSLSAVAFTIGNASFVDLGNGFSLSGDLLSGQGISDLTLGFVPTGTNVGTFSMSVSAVPEPSSVVLLCATAGGLAIRLRKRHRVKSQFDLAIADA